MLSRLEARVTRLVNVFNYANVVAKEHHQLPVSVLFDRSELERAAEIHVGTVSTRNTLITFMYLYYIANFHTFHFSLSVKNILSTQMYFHSRQRQESCIDTISFSYTLLLTFDIA